MTADDLPHRCHQIARAVHDDTLPVNYHPRMREYSITYVDGGSSVQLINFCPFCGSRLPAELRDEWLTRVRAMGLDPWDDPIPDAFQSDRWWRDAGL